MATMTSLTRRDFLKLGGATLLASALAPLSEALSASGLPAAPVIYHGSRRFPKIALTVDDCDLVHLLQRLERLFDTYPDFHVTFFPKGVVLLSNEEKDPGIWKRLHEKGHEIGYHSWKHDILDLFPTEKIIEDFDRWYDAFRQVMKANVDVRFARPPGGNGSPQFLEMCKVRNLVCTMWTLERGWGDENTADVIKYKVPQTRNGDIILMHTRTYQVETIHAALPWVASHELKLVTLRELYYDLQREQNQPRGCEASAGSSLTRTCMD
jgi:peptidoglycan/xylan/chitin deacetylase (PgdA/CDA1 family)